MARKRIVERDVEVAAPDARSGDDAARADRRITRRRFVTLLAAGATAALATPALATGAAGTAKRPHGAAPTPSPKVAKGVADQKESLAKTLKTIRSFELPPGSEQAFAFRPVPARRKS